MSADLRVYSLRGEGDPCTSQNIRCSHSIFPVLLEGNSAPNSLWMLASSAHYGPDFEEIPCIFPEIREIAGDRFALVSQHSQTNQLL